jgi:CDP-glucose 4,6-dehydratase
MNKGFWQGKRVFVTGHTGFKGSWLALFLRHFGAEVAGFALAPATSPNLWGLLDLNSDIQATTDDIRNASALRTAVTHFQPEIVFHLAAQALVRASYVDPVETYSTNVMGTVNLLEAVRATPSVRAVVSVTSDKCYDNQEWVWGYREADPIGGHDPYSSSKGCAELVTAAYRSSFFNPVKYSDHGVAIASCRAGNVVGGGDWSDDRLIPDVIRSIAAGQAVDIRNPNATRPWQHVLEPLSGYLLVAEKLVTDGVAYGEAWNFGPGAEGDQTVIQVVEQLIAKFGQGKIHVAQNPDNPHEAGLLKLDISKARDRLGWQPRWNVAQTLDAVVNWHKGLESGAEIQEMSLKQVEQYNTIT